MPPPGRTDGPRAPGPYQRWARATLLSRTPETGTARTLVLRAPGWPGHLPGQHIDIRLTAEDGYRAARSYSLAAPGRAEHLEIGVQPVAGGEVSPYLAEQLPVGADVEVRGPLGGWFVWKKKRAQKKKKKKEKKKKKKKKNGDAARPPHRGRAPARPPRLLRTRPGTALVRARTRGLRPAGVRAAPAHQDRAARRPAPTGPHHERRPARRRGPLRAREPRRLRLRSHRLRRARGRPAPPRGPPRGAHPHRTLRLNTGRQESTP
ncbi:FAD-binding oxidoreductase [Streptomyces sp. SPB074]|uniref:FAD-binding oxidoreductase n=1 Tax=Streptomyces sp. (strain SPB074) TaxID=465543 RepID=UPI001F35B7DE|nr:FAD-binding oxidoreductase [Streptomyces sp. SPB074]